MARFTGWFSLSTARKKQSADTCNVSHALPHKGHLRVDDYFTTIIF